MNFCEGVEIIKALEVEDDVARSLEFVMVGLEVIGSSLVRFPAELPFELLF